MLDQAAWLVFRSCQTQWDHVAGLGGMMRTGLKYDRVRIVAEANRFVLNAPLLARIARLEALSLLDEAAQHRGGDDADGDVAEGSVN